MSKTRIINPAASSFKNVSKNAKAMSANVVPVKNYLTTASITFSSIINNKSNNANTNIRI